MSASATADSESLVRGDPAHEKSIQFRKIEKCMDVCLKALYLFHLSVGSHLMFTSTLISNRGPSSSVGTIPTARSYRPRRAPMRCPLEHTGSRPLATCSRSYILSSAVSDSFIHRLFYITRFYNRSNNTRAIPCSNLIKCLPRCR